MVTRKIRVVDSSDSHSLLSSVCLPFFSMSFQRLLQTSVTLDLIIIPIGEQEQIALMVIFMSLLEGSDLHSVKKYCVFIVF